eukprot:GFUD01038450.1.p1 GENE.GFUD01038450.1~~GFUD01038450.1.p1  ORF type:complete len:444 (-),score=128.22 GFUD01038450.1:42-1373(-)
MAHQLSGNSISSAKAPPSPLHKIIFNLPSPTSIKRVSLSSPTSSPSPSKKRLKSNESSILSSPDMRRQVLVKKVRQKLAGVTVTVVDKVGKELVELDESVKIVTDTNDNESLSLEERFAPCKTGLAKGDLKPVEFKPGELKAPVELKAMKKKKVEIQWIPVKRIKRKTRLFLFGATVNGDKDEVIVEKAETNQKVPRVINGRRPFIVVPGVEYDLEEGEGVMANTEEEDAEMRLARNEKYEMDSFVCDTGYLSDEELMETPTVDKVISKVKQQRRANNIQAKLKFEKMGEPLVLGCLWWSGKGGQKQKMKKWQAILLTNSPIPTSFTTPIPEEQCSPLLPPPPPPVTAPASLSHVLPTPTNYETKYHVKYLVKHLVHQSMRGADGPNQCSTPMPGQKVIRQFPVTLSILTSQMMEQGGDIMEENKELVDRYVAKYFNKFKYQM